MEHIDRQTYDPHEPLVIAHGDLLAARNAVTQLVMILRDRWDPPSTYQRESVRTGARYAVEVDGPDEFETFDEAVEWLANLRDRLRGYLPHLPPTERP